MKKSTKILLIVAASLFVAGASIFVCVMSMLKWNFSKLVNVKYETNTYNIENDFSNIYITTNTADITLVKSDSGKCYVECDETNNLEYSVFANNNTLEIKLNDNRKWYHHIGIFNGTKKITVYLPEGEYRNINIENNTGITNIPADFKFENIDVKSSTGFIKCYASANGTIKLHASTGHIYASDVTANNIDIKVSTGDIALSNISAAGNIYTKVSTGDIILENISCNNFISEGSTGYLNGNNITTTGKLEIERSTGDIKIDFLSAGEVDIDTDTGKVNLYLTKEMVVYAESDTGRIDAPRSTQGGICEIDTDTGDIKVTFIG